MMVLSIRQPWAWAIVAGFKTVENRTWPTSYRGRLAIHAGKVEERHDVGYVIREVAHQSGLNLDTVEARYTAKGYRGAVVGAVTLAECADALPDDPWFFGPYGFRFVDPAQLSTPIPMRGRLGIWSAPELEL